MTPTSRGTGPEDRLVQLAPRLHRTAVLLNGGGNTDRATTLVLAAARAMRAHPRQDPDPAEQVALVAMVRAFLRHAPHGGDRLPTGVEDDRDDPLQALSPRARAATVLSRVHGWDERQISRAVRVRPARVAALVATGGAVASSLEVLAEQHAVPDAVLRDRLGKLLADRGGPAYPAPGRAGPRRTPRLLPRRSGRLVAALVASAVVVTYAVTQDVGRPVREVGDPAPAPAATGAPDLSSAGWRLDEDGEPPAVRTGLRLLGSAQVSYPEREQELVLDWAPEGGAARWAVLWCDMPPFPDPHVEVPHGVLAVDGEGLELPCAGRDGSPPVRDLVAVPADPGLQRFDLSLHGDLVRHGSALLAVYAEPPRGSLGYGTPAPRISGDEAVLGEPPEGGADEDSGSVVLEPSVAGPSLAPWAYNVHAREVTAKVRVGPDSVVEVWAGDSGVLTVLADGVPVTDDGDLAADVWPDRPEEGPVPDWRAQDPMLRDGQWLVPVPGTVHRFAFPRPRHGDPGAEREVTVTVPLSGGSTPSTWQVVVRDATRLPPPTDALAPVATADLPVYAAGRRLVGTWQVPADGLVRQLGGVPEWVGEPGWDLVGVAVGPPAQHPVVVQWPALEDVLAGGSTGTELAVVPDAGRALDQVSGWPTGVGLPTGVGPLRVRVAPRPGHPVLPVLVYASVPWEDYDPTGAPPPAASWPAGSAPPEWLVPDVRAKTTVHTADDFDEDHRLEVELPSGASLLRMTGQGKGRVRVLAGGEPVDLTRAADGWWSAYTDRAVTAELDLAHYPPSDALELVLDGDEDFRRSLRLELHVPQRP